jgi:hypothetical protein
MSDISNSNNSRRRNFQGSLPTTNYQMPANFAQKDIQFPKAPSLGEFTPANSGIKRDWSGSEMNVPEFKGLNAIGKGLQGKANAKRDSLFAKPAKVTLVDSEGENVNPAPRTRPDGSPIKPFPSFGDDSEDSGSQDSGSPTKKRGATSYDEETGELMMDLDSEWTMTDTGRAAKEGAKAAGRLAKRVGSRVLKKGRERLNKGGGQSAQFDSSDDPFSSPFDDEVPKGSSRYKPPPPPRPRSGGKRTNDPPPRPFPSSLKDDPFA